MTAKQPVQAASGAGAASHAPLEWHAINWRRAQQNVRRLQARIVKAIQDGRWGKVRALQHLLTHSFSAKALAVRRVTENQGKRTPGVDRVTWRTPEQKASAIGTLRQRSYRPQPLRRVYVAKSNGKRRGLGIPTIKDFLGSRGLEINEVKTKTVHVTEGFNFLGLTIRRFKKKLIVYPQKEKVLSHIDAIRSYLKTHRQAFTGQVIRDLNPKIRGWTNYYRFSAAKSTFSNVQYHTYWMLWAWAKRRHPKKSAKWIVKRYYRQVEERNAVFSAGNAQLLWHGATQVTRYTKVTGKSSPMDPELVEYWSKRERWRTARMTFQSQRRALLKKQEGKCGLCKQTLYADDLMDTHHINPRHVGGEHSTENRILVHRWCYHGHHQRHGYKVAEARAV